MSREGVSGMSGSEHVTRGASAAGELSGPRCILPGCRNGAEEQGLPCGECAEAFGSHLWQTDGPAMTVEAQAKRDNETQAAYAVLLAGGDPARVAATGQAAEQCPNLVLKLAVGGSIDGFIGYDEAIADLAGEDRAGQPV